MLYLHSAGLNDVCKGDVRLRQLQVVSQEAIPGTFLGKGCPGPWDEFIGLAPCCPPNLAWLEPGSVPKAMKRHKVYWFKVCETFAYASWDFSEARRCFEMELLVTELLFYVFATLPVDPQRIYFVGPSCGGYAVLRLAELLPQVPAAVVSMAGYYPDIPEQQHDPLLCAARLREVRLILMHCKEDKLCRTDSPHVSKLYERLEEQGTHVEWVDPSVAKGSTKSYHCAHQQVLQNPAMFFARLSTCTPSNPNLTMHDVLRYLRDRFRSLLPEHDFNLLPSYITDHPGD